jgi:transcriptional regulator with XRE-family HTH domain
MPTDYANQRSKVAPPVASLRGFRTFANVTLDALARRISAEGYAITKAGLGNIETGTRGPSQEFLEAWARAMDSLAQEKTGGRFEEVPQTIDREARAAARTRSAAA